MKNSKLGCHIAGMCFNAIMYADDLSLLVISLRDLQLMVDLCIEELNCLDLKINVNKSVCMRIGRKHSEKIDSIEINNQLLTWKQEMRYLGVYFVSANSFKCNIQTSRQKFFRALNGIFAQIGTRASPSVILSLVNSFCLPVLLYGIEAMSMNVKIRNALHNAFRTIFVKIFASFDHNVILNCQYFCGILPLCYRLDMRVIEFFKDLMNTTNVYLKFHFLRTGNKMLKELLKKYNVESMISTFQLKYIMWKHFESSFNL